jgi:hypothetical protein
MAARNPRPVQPSGRSARPARSTSSKKPAAAKKKEPTPEGEELGGIGWEGGIGIITFIVVVAAFLFIDADISKYPDQGIFFGK